VRLSRWLFEPVPPHLFALLRITWALLGLMGLAGVRDIDAFWEPGGLVAPVDTAAHHLATRLAINRAGTILFSLCVAAYVWMLLGVWTRGATLAAFAAAVIETNWNQLPLSGAYQAHRVLLFYLVWADCGQVWSVDAWLARKRGQEPSWQPIWPLRCWRYQVALIYLISGVWKLQDVHWRDGAALHYVLSNVQFRRFPFSPPPWSAELLTAGTYVTLGWELLFPLLILWNPTRRLALLLGILLHLGMFVTIEIGPFSLVMIGSYLAFADPHTVPGVAERTAARFRRRLTSTPP